MNIALVNNRYQLGGAETVMQQLHRGLVSAGHRSSIHLGENVEPSLPAHARHLYPATLHRLFHSRLNRWVRRFAHRKEVIDRRFINLARNHQLVHVHNFHGLYASTSALAELAKRVPLVWTFHRFWGVTGGCDHPGECRRYLDACGACPRVNEWPIGGIDNTQDQLSEKLRLLAPSSLVVVSPSEHLARVVRESQVGRNWRVETIPNGVDPNEILPFDPARHDSRASLGIHPTKTTVLAVNRSFADPLKGGEILAEAASRLDFSRAQLLLVGGETKAVKVRLPPEADVLDFGYISDRQRLAAILRHSDLFLYASPRENFPCATLEAMSAGCCVVSTPTDGVLEQIRDNKEGCFSVDFSGSALAAAANRLIDDPARARAFGHAARTRIVRDFSETRMVDRHLALYAELIASPGKLRHA